MMPYLNRLLRFTVFSNLFISLCAAAMTWHCFNVTGLPADHSTILFIFFATLASYSFHWMLTTEWLGSNPRALWQQANPRVHPLMLVPALVTAIYFGWQVRQHWPVLLLISGLTFVYSAPKIPHPLFRALRHIAVGKTIFLALVWTLATTLIPITIAGGRWPAGSQVFLLNRFFLVYAICILFDLRDLEYDRQHGIRSLVTWLSTRGVRNLFILSILLFLATACQLLATAYSPLSVLNLLLPGLITASLYRVSLRSTSDMLYYLLLDGLMALPAFTSLAWLAVRNMTS